MINKNQFSIKNTKKVLHKVGKQWVVVSAVLLGLVAGNTVVGQTHVGAKAAGNNPSEHQVKSVVSSSAASNMNSQVSQSSANSSGNSLSSSNSSHSSSMSVSSSASTSVGSSAVSSANPSNNMSGAASANSHRAPASFSTSNMGDGALFRMASPENSDNGQFNFDLASMADFQHVVNVIGNKISPSSDASKHSAAVSGFNDLLNIASAGNISHFASGARLCEDTSSNSDTSTWIGEFNQAVNDINAINNNGPKTRFNSLTNTVNSVANKLYSRSIVLPYVGKQNVNNVINEGYNDDIGVVYSINTNNYSINDVTSIINNNDVDFQIRGYRYGLTTHSNHHDLRNQPEKGIINNTLKEFIYDKLSKILINNENEFNITTMIYGLNTISVDSTMSLKYDDILNELKDMVNQPEYKQALQLNKISSNLSSISNSMSSKDNISGALSDLADNASNTANNVSSSEISKDIKAINSNLDRINSMNNDITKSDQAKVSNANSQVNSSNINAESAYNMASTASSATSHAASLVSSNNQSIADSKAARQNADNEAAYMTLISSMNASASASVARQNMKHVQSSQVASSASTANHSGHVVRKAKPSKIQRVKNNVAKSQRTLNKARQALKKAHTRRAKRAAQRQLRKAQANYNQAKQNLSRNNRSKMTVREASRAVAKGKRNLNKAKLAVKRARGWRAKRLALRNLRKARAQYKTVNKQLTRVRRQKAVNSAYKNLTKVTQHGSHRARRKACHTLNNLKNEKKTIAKLRRHLTKRNCRALKRANVKLTKMENSLLH